MYSTTKLKKIRKENGYTIYKMAQLLGITAPYYSQIENRKRRLYYEMACKIANLFNMTPDQIFLQKKDSQ